MLAKRVLGEVDGARKLRAHTLAVINVFADVRPESKILGWIQNHTQVRQKYDRSNRWVFVRPVFTYVG